MFGIHTDFNCPDDDTIVWKYMDLFKFLDLISTKKLFMLKNTEFIDKRDGKDNNTIDSYKENSNPQLHRFLEKNYESNIDLNDRVRGITFVNCWHINEYESSVMWDSYSNSNGGIAIRTTIGRIKKSITDEREVFISKVNYSNLPPRIGNIFFPIIQKSVIYRDERELRLFHSDLPNLHNGVKEKFIKIDVNVDELIDEVYFHPLTPEWVVQSLNNIILNINSNLAPKKSEIYS
ncbi:hypothetical protein FM120_31505 [Sphingobacterium faecium PCAi_F2.5]|nr:hypothetical protein FM120_31505 [Sphingobacterium faecium PCAi_F2.5]